MQRVTSSKEIESFERQRYLKYNVKSLGSTNQESKTNYGTSSEKNRNKYLTEASKISRALEQSSNQPWVESVRSSFRSQTQEMLFRSMKVLIPERKVGDGIPRRPSSAHGLRGSRTAEGIEVKPTLSAQHSKNLVERLSGPAQRLPSKLDLKLDPSLRHTTYSDAQNCRFRPITVAGIKRRKLAAQQSNDNNNDNRKEDAKFNFINRQEADERTRREELEFEIGKKDYDAIVDKKMCPKCGAKKSYDEVKEKKKLCPNCKVEYCHAVDWAKISKSFFRKGHEYAQRSQEHRARIAKEIEEETYVTKKMIDHETGSIIEMKQPLKQKITAAEETEFFARMEEKLRRRESKLQQLESESLASCTFQPSVYPSMRNTSRSEYDDENIYDDEEERRRDPVQSFLNRYQDDLHYRKERFPEKFK